MQSQSLSYVPVQSLDQYRSMVSIEDELSPGHGLSAEFYQQSDATVASERRLRRRWLVESDGVLAGYVGISHDPFFFHPKRFNVIAKLRPSVEGELAADALAFLESQAREPGAESIKLLTNENRKVLIAQAMRAGFEEIYRNFWSTRSLEDFEPAPYDPLFRRLETEDIRIVPLSALESDPDYRKKVFALELAFLEDIPMTVDRPRPVFDDYWSYVDRNCPKRDTFFIALDGDRYIGAHLVWGGGSFKHFVISTTGVLREYRRRGVCTALKVTGMKAAKEAGAPFIRTFNASNNHPVLAMNAKFGFVREPAEVALQRRL